MGYTINRLWSLTFSIVTEFIATHLVAMEILWAKALLGAMGHVQLDATILGEGKMSTIAKINNRSNSNKTKHIVIRLNLIREQVLKMIIEF